MKRIINGHRYDTDKATLVASATGGSEFVTDFRYWSEELYRSPRGKWFISGEGGAMSTWSRPVSDGMTGGGSGVRPLSPDDARLWLEAQDETAAIEQWFGTELEDA